MKISENGEIGQRSRSPDIVSNKSNLMIRSMDEDCKSDGGTKRVFAQAHMSFIMPLSPYNAGAKNSDGDNVSSRSPLPSSPSNFQFENINFENLKSNNNKEQAFIDFDAKMSDG